MIYEMRQFCVKSEHFRCWHYLGPFISRSFPFFLSADIFFQFQWTCQTGVHVANQQIVTRSRIIGESGFNNLLPSLTAFQRKLFATVANFEFLRLNKKFNLIPKSAIYPVIGLENYTVCRFQTENTWYSEKKHSQSLQKLQLIIFCCKFISIPMVKTFGIKRICKCDGIHVMAKN